MTKDPWWNLLRSGAKEEGLRLIERGYEREPLTHEMDLGIGYLFTDEYVRAWKHFTRANQESPTPTSIVAGMAGVAKWCLNKPEEGMAEWREGLRCEFTDWAGGVELPLLMYFASVARPDEFLKFRAEAEKLLTKRAGSHLIRNWPGPLAEFVLSRIDESTLRNKCQQNDEVDTSLYHRLADFYVALKARASGDIAKWNATVRKIADTSGPEWSNHDFFLGSVWSEEFFLARHEASLLTSNA